MDYKELKEKIDALPYEKVTEASIKARIKKTTFFTVPDTTVTLCNITMINGFSFRGESACIDRRNYNKEIGEELAQRDAFSKIWAFEGYLMAERRYKDQQAIAAPFGGLEADGAPA